MAITTRTYSSLLSQVEALAGVTFSTQETTWVKSMVNRRAQQAYRSCDYWPRFLVGGESRFVSNGHVPYSEVTRNTVDTFLRIFDKDPNGSQYAREIEFYVTGSGAELVNARLDSGTDVLRVAGTATANVYNPDTGTNDQLPLSGDYVQTGPYEYTLTRTDIGNSAYHPLNLKVETHFSILLFWAFTAAYLGQPSTVSWQGADSASPGEPETLIAPESDSFSAWAFTSPTPTGNISSITRVQLSSVFCHYKAALSETYGDGTGETNAIPAEWFEYIAHGVYSDWLRSDGQTEKAVAEETFAREFLDQELERIDRQHIGTFIANRIQTHGSTSAR